MSELKKKCCCGGVVVGPCGCALPFESSKVVLQFWFRFIGRTYVGNVNAGCPPFPDCDPDCSFAQTPGMQFASGAYRFAYQLNPVILAYDAGSSNSGVAVWREEASMDWGSHATVIPTFGGGTFDCCDEISETGDVLVTALFNKLTCIWQFTIASDGDSPSLQFGPNWSGTAVQNYDPCTGIRWEAPCDTMPVGEAEASCTDWGVNAVNLSISNGTGLGTPCAQECSLEEFHNGVPPFTDICTRTGRQMIYFLDAHRIAI